MPTVPELRDRAADLGLSLPSRARKAEIAAAVEQAEREADLSVVSAVERDLAEIAKLDPQLSRSSLAASALALARELDSPDNSATSKSNCARALLDTLERLRVQAPDREKKDDLDELSAKRAARRAAS